MMPFEVFKVHPPQPMLSIRYQCVYLWPAARAALGNPSHVLWLYDADTRRIGLRASDAVPNAYRVTKSGTVATTAFFRQIGIDLPLGIKMIGEKVDDVLAFALPTETDTEITNA